MGCDHEQGGHCEPLPRRRISRHLLPSEGHGLSGIAIAESTIWALDEMLRHLLLHDRARGAEKTSSLESVVNGLFG
jgi:hypothetical protein